MAWESDEKNIDHADSENRKLNAILFGLAEQPEKKVANQVQEFVTTKCHLQNHGPVNAYCLGKVQEEQKTRDQLRCCLRMKMINGRF